MMSLKGQAIWAKMTPLGGGGQANSTGVIHDQISEQS
jgi:hypothetical protein